MAKISNSSAEAQSPEDLIFDLFRVADRDEASVPRFLSVLRACGLQKNDPRLRPMLLKISQFEAEHEADDSDVKSFTLGRERFKLCVSESSVLVTKALRNGLIIPDWQTFCSVVKEIFDKCKAVTDGNVATYIPQLARAEPTWWGVSVCTVDGQRASWGDSRLPFCFQSVSKTFNYAIAASDLSADFVHNYVGQEPSGRLFNEICLDSRSKPHNPMVNAGAIIVTSLIKRGLCMADRFDFVLTQYKKLAGDLYIGFNNATFLSERDTADRNYALSFYMKGFNCFPSEDENVRDTLDFYFQLCSLETNCEAAAVMAATLANGGVCPLSGEKVIDNRPCRDALSLMYSCGLYDYSGKFAFQVGLPAKSGVSGCLIVTIPNLMGICLWSPPLDRMGNSVRGVEFCKELVERFNFHNYDSLLQAGSQKIDPRKHLLDVRAESTVTLLFAAKAGDVGAIRRSLMRGCDMEVADYDKRTPLHVAASEGHARVVRFLLDTARVKPDPRDRWNRTPLEDAVSFGHKECVLVLQSTNQLVE